MDKKYCANVKIHVDTMGKDCYIIHRKSHLDFTNAQIIQLCSCQMHNRG